MRRKTKIENTNPKLIYFGLAEHFASANVWKVTLVKITAEIPVFEGCTSLL